MFPGVYEGQQSIGTLEQPISTLGTATEPWGKSRVEQAFDVSAIEKRRNVRDV